MSDETEVAPVETPKPDFANHELHTAIKSFIETSGGFATGRLEQLLAEMRDLINKQ